MARLGKRTALSAKVGDDAFGRMVREKVAEAGVDVGGVRLDARLPTAISVVMINPKGDRTFLFQSGALPAYSIEDVDETLVRRARHVNFGSFFAHPFMDRGGAGELFRLAHACGATTSADVTHDGDGLGLAGIRDSLRDIDYFFPSYAEGRHLTGETDPERIADVLLRETGDKTIVLKMGEGGCYVRSQGRGFYSAAFVAAAVDTTGAGDNFVAGFLTGLSNGWPLEECADFANATAGFSVRYVGATTPEMSPENVREFMKSTPRSLRAPAAVSP